MTQARNYACLQTFGFLGMAQTDNLSALNAASQTTATRLNSKICRVVTSVSTGSVILPQQLTGENGPAPVIVINDSPNSINLYPAAGETINALSANTAFAVPSLQTAVCIPNDVPPPHGGVATGSNLNWGVANIP
jgi:hypothetical protein